MNYESFDCEGRTLSDATEWHTASGCNLLVECYWIKTSRKMFVRREQYKCRVVHRKIMRGKNKRNKPCSPTGHGILVTEVVSI